MKSNQSDTRTRTKGHKKTPEFKSRNRKYTKFEEVNRKSTQKQKGKKRFSNKNKKIIYQFHSFKIICWAAGSWRDEETEAQRG